MPRFVHPKTRHAIETTSPRDRADLLAQGYREQKAKTTAVRQADTKPKTDAK